MDETELDIEELVKLSHISEYRYDQNVDILFDRYLGIR